MNWWPRTWFQQEDRLVENQGDRIGDAFAEFLRQEISQGSAGSKSSPGTVLVANLTGRAFASAVVTGVRVSVQEALSPSMLFELGRQLVFSGESLWYVKVGSQGLRLYNVDQYDVSGGYDEARHLYRLELQGPTTTTEIKTTRNRVLHFKYTNANAGASVFSQLASRLVEHYRDESRSPRGSVIVTPDGGDDKTKMVEDLGQSRGHVNVFKSARLPGAQAGTSNWQLHKLGMDPSASMVELSAQVFQQQLALHGVSAGLFSGSAGGAREGFRQAIAQLVTPLSLLVTEELRSILDQPELRMQFSGLKSADIIGRSRAYATLTDDKLSRAEALELSGLRN